MALVHRSSAVHRVVGMTLVEMLLIALVVIALAVLGLVFLAYVYISQINDMIAAFISAYSNQPRLSTEATQREVYDRLSFIETMMNNWRNGR